MTLTTRINELIRAGFSGIWISSHEHQDAIAELSAMAFAQCRECIAKELSLQDSKHSHESPARESIPVSETRNTNRSNSASNHVPRTATEAQVRAIRAIASKAGVSLASELEQEFGVHSPNQLTISQASQLIDSLKQGLSPSST